MQLQRIRPGSTAPWLPAHAVTSQIDIADRAPGQSLPVQAQPWNIGRWRGFTHHLHCRLAPWAAHADRVDGTNPNVVA